jgi:dihydrofolate reductase
VGETIWHITMSLDGFIAGPDQAMEWAFENAPDDPEADRIKDGTGAVLGGRGWYDAAARLYHGVDGIYGGAWTGPVFVLTHRTLDLPDDPKVTFVSSGLADALAAARTAAGDRNVEIFGATVARECLAAGELDEVIVHIAPILLGDGVRMYGTPPAPHVPLELTQTRPYHQSVSVRYSVKR